MAAPEQKKQISPTEKLVAELANRDIYQVIDKFLEDEAKYAKELRTLNEFENRLQTHFKLEDYILNPDEINSIFGTTGALFTFHQGLSERLNRKRWDGPEQFLSEIGDMLVRDIQFFKMYGQYNQDLKACLGKLEYYLEDNSKFRRWLEFNEHCYHVGAGGFARLLKLPQAHFPTYTIYLQSMVSALGKLDASHPATGSITNAFQKFVEVLDDISRKAESTMRSIRVVEIQKSHFGDKVTLVEASRKWYRTSRVKIKDLKENKKVQDATLILFNDCLVYSTPGFFGGNGLTGVMSIAGLTIKPITGLQHTFKLVSSITNREWEIQCISQEDSKQSKEKESAERSYYAWLGALLKVFKWYYNIEDIGKGGIAATAPTRAMHPEDIESLMKKKPCPNPRMIEKPAPDFPSEAQAEYDKIAKTRQQTGGAAKPAAATAAATTTTAPAAAAAAQPAVQPPKNLSVNVEQQQQKPAQPAAMTPRRAAPIPEVPEVKLLTDDEIRDSLKEGTKLGDWEKVWSEPDQAFYYENLPQELTQWEDPQEFIDEFNRLRKQNDDAYAAYLKAKEERAAAVAAQQEAENNAMLTKSASSVAPPALPPSTPARPPATAGGPPSLPPQTPAAGGPPALPPQTPGGAGGPPALPPSTPGGMPANPMRNALLGAIQGGAALKKADEPPTPTAGGGAGRGGLLGAISGGVQLKKVDASAAPPATPKAGGGGLLGAISGGVQLKKVDQTAPKPAPAAAAAGPAGISLESNLMASLNAYRKYVADDEGEGSDDDDDW